MPKPATTAETLVPHLERCGYSASQLARDFKVDDVTIEVAAFAGKPWDTWSACLAAVNLDGDSRRSAQKAIGLGAASVFVCGPEGVDWYGLGVNGPSDPRPISWTQVGGVFREHKDELAPSRIYNAKLGRPAARSSQLWFFDAGLMPLVEKRRGQTLLTLVEDAIDGLHAQLGNRLRSRQAQEDVYRTVFWQLAAKVLHDKRVPNFVNIDLTDVDLVFDRVGKHHGDTGRLPPFGKDGRKAINAMAAAIARCGSLADVSSESIAYVYENALLDQTAGGDEAKGSEKPYDIRKELGIHSTPPALIQHMLSQMWGMVEEIAPADRFVFEPACGHAPFLTAAMRWLRTWNSEGQSDTDHEYMRKHLRGVEADSFAIELAKLALTLADEPYGNSWLIQKGDMFEPGLLAREAKKAHILLANPPYEAFKDKDKRKYRDLGEATVANTKATEMLRRTLPHLSDGGVFGIVMPIGVLHDKESTASRRDLLKDFELSEISIFSDNLFEHGDHEVAVLMGRKNSRTKYKPHIKYRRVREAGMEAFKSRLAFSSERDISQDLFLQRPTLDLRLPELGEVWAYLSSYPTLNDQATMAKGLDYKGESLPEGSWTIRKQSASTGSLGYANVDSDLQIFGLPSPVKLNLDPKVVLSFRAGRPPGKAQVLLNYARIARSPWKLKAVLDEGGHAITSRFSAIRPRDGGPSALYIWAVLNSPIANAFAYLQMDGRDILVGAMRQLPVPPRSPGREIAIERAATHYRKIASDAPPLFQKNAAPEKVKHALMEMDAAVLSAYDLPAKYERQLLNLFDGIERKGVGLDGQDGRSTFRGYFPNNLTSYVPLREFISDTYAASTAGRLAREFQPVQSKVALEALKIADKLATGD